LLRVSLQLLKNMVSQDSRLEELDSRRCSEELKLQPT